MCLELSIFGEIFYQFSSENSPVGTTFQLDERTEGVEDTDEQTITAARQNYKETEKTLKQAKLLKIGTTAKNSNKIN